MAEDGGASVSRSAKGPITGEAPSDLRLSVVIPTRDRRGQLSEVLAPLLTDPGASEVVVVDDGSQDGTAELVEELAAVHPHLRLVRGSGGGKGVASQAGLEAATGDVLLFLDDDVVPDPGLALGHLRHHLERPGLVVVGYMPVREEALRAGLGPALVYSQDYERICRRAERSPHRILEDLWGGNVSMRRDDLLRVGLRSAQFDSRWRHIDRELGLRCLDAGLIGVFDRALRATHHYERDLGAMLDEAQWTALGRIHLHEAHAERLGPLRWRDWFTDLTLLRALLVRAGSTRLGHPLVRGALVLACRVAGRTGRVADEIVLTRLLRRTEQAFHARRLLSGGDGPGGRRRDRGA